MASKYKNTSRAKSTITLDDYTFLEIQKLAEYCDFANQRELLEALAYSEKEEFRQFMEQNHLLE